MSDKKYPNNLHFFECEDCDYAFVAKVDEYGVMRIGTRININRGDLTASHTYFYVPEEPPQLEITANVG